MALGRRQSQGLSRDVWPAFVDVMTSLLLVLMFVLSIFMVMQHFTSETIAHQTRDIESQKTALLEQEAALDDTRAEVEEKTLALNDLAIRLGQLGEMLSLEQTQSSQLQDAQAQLLASLSATSGDRDRLASSLSDSERRSAALDAERQRLEGDAAALTLQLEAQRRRAEDTLTLLAAAQAARAVLESDSARELAEAMSESERQAALLAVAQAQLTDQEELNLEDRRQIELLNQQLLALRTQLASVATALDAADAEGETPEARVADLGARLNVALADKVDELTRYRSEFFGRVREAVEGREGVRVVGDRFVFQSEVLFPIGSAELGEAGRGEIAKVAEILKSVSDAIPPEVPWVLRVDGHTDRRPIVGGIRYTDNWELSQARALSVARFLINEEGFPADRVAATGFGEFQPLDSGEGPAAFARNRRIELKLTER